VEWSIDSSLRRVVLTIADPYTLEQWQAAITGVLQHSSFVPGFGFLVDRRACSAPTTEFIQKQIDFLAGEEPLRVPHRVALVVRPNDPAAFGMARMLEIRAEFHATGIQHRIFQSIEAAERWLEGTG
jgi:hypothetical protein